VHVVHLSDYCLFVRVQVKMSLCGNVILRIPYLQMITVRVYLYFYTYSVLHVTFADVRGSGVVVVNLV